MATPRAGNTVKVSVSLDKSDLAVLQKYAKGAHRGNLSAAFSEAAKWIRQRQARQRLIEELGGPILTTEASKAIEAAQQARPARGRRKPA